MAFISVARTGVSALVQEAFADDVADALIDRRGCEPLTGEGRGAVFRFPVSDGFGILRPCLRGGLIRHLLGDAYVGVNRPERELAVHRYAYEAGLRVPEPLGACWMRSGFLYRGAMATREVQSESLLAYLEAEPERESAEKVLRETGQLIREMHDAGIYHADLQIRNILVGAEGCYLIDFDKAERRSEMSELARYRNLLRLRRSFEKHGRLPQEIAALKDSYGELEETPGASALYKARGVVSDKLSGRTGRRE